MKVPPGEAAIEDAALPTPPSSGRWSGLSGHLNVFLLLIGLLLFWQFVVPILVPGYVFPTLDTVIDKFAAILRSRGTYIDLLSTTLRILGGFAVSGVVGVAFGIALAMSKQLNATFMPVVRFVTGVPALTWVLLAIIWFRSTELRIWFLMLVLMAPIVTVNTYDGVRAISYELYQMALSLRPSKLRLLCMIILPGAMPFIFSGLKVGLSFGGRFVVFAEAMSADSGIGSAMYTMNQTFDIAGIIVWTLLLVIVLAILDVVLTRIERYWFRWRRDFQG
jgi:ABC-type nitrate/sulfonate/bicarbonate transport system permease component